METNPEFELAYDMLTNTRANIFLTGKAGTGKTTFLRSLSGKLSKAMVVVAPTGVAALNAGGMTIHSFFQITPGPYTPMSKQSPGERAGTERFFK
ncbi:MAG: AAA family ATPase, partial [Rikenellaceae bacterium]|nr:AAA family ATPase [Rikenellaceae bacterium]